MKKKFLTLLLALALSASVLAGCGNTVESVDSDSVVVEEPQTDETSDTTEVTDAGEDVPVVSETDEASDVTSNYVIAISPYDFTIDGFDVFCGKTSKEMYDAVNLPDYYELSQSDVHIVARNGYLDRTTLPMRDYASANNSDYGWSEGYWNDDDFTGFTLHAPDGQFTLATYHYYKAQDSSSRDISTIYFSDIEGHSIADADFIQSPFIPGETTFTEAIKILGIQDILEDNEPYYFVGIECETPFSEFKSCFFDLIYDPSINEEYIGVYWNSTHLGMEFKNGVLYRFSISH